MRQSRTAIGCIGRRTIDFTSNSPNMTTVTCQRSRIVSPTGIVPIRRYIFVAFRDFFPKTAGRRTASENDQASIMRGPAARRKTGEDDVDAATTGGREGDSPSIFCHLLGFTTSHRVSTLPGTYQHVMLVYSSRWRGGTIRECPRAPPRICLSKRTLAGCCLDIMEKREYHTA